MMKRLLYSHNFKILNFKVTRTSNKRSTFTTGAAHCFFTFAYNNGHTVFPQKLLLSCSVSKKTSLRESSPIRASEASLARTCERAAKPQAAHRSRVLARLAQIGELARRVAKNWPVFYKWDICTL